MRPRIAISVGDPNGIGPEVALRCVLDSEVLRYLDPVLVGNRAGLSLCASSMGLDGIPIPVVDPGGDFEAEPSMLGQICPEAGHASMLAVETAVQLCRDGECDAMVTAPISKEAIALAGYGFPGHTEFIAELCGSMPHIMLLVSGALRVGLVTGHLPVREVAAAVTIDRVVDRLRVFRNSLFTDFGIETPRIAVLGLNPHASDGGVLGSEEDSVIRPAMNLAIGSSPSVDCFGPFAADGFFGNRSYRQYDGVLAMYHDQGLAPFKTIAFGSGVNFTAGLPIVRTSPDHGTAFDIAGKNLARPDSMRSALLLATEISRARSGVLSSSPTAT